MALPPDFKEFEHLQDLLRKKGNQSVAAFFGDLGENWEPSLTPDRSAVRVACTHKDTDTGVMTIMRSLFLFLELGYIKNGLAVYYGNPDEELFPVKGHPKITLHFSQDAQSVPAQERKAFARCSVRLMKLENTSTNLKSKLIEIANEIKNEFIDNKKGIVLTKGNIAVSYLDKANGFPRGTRIYTNNKSDAIDTYQRICRCIDVPYENYNITVHDPEKPSTIGLSAGTQIIMGETYKIPAYRRVVNVRFRYAVAIVPGLKKPVYLVDTTGQNKALVKLPWVY